MMRVDERIPPEAVTKFECSYDIAQNKLLRCKKLRSDIIDSIYVASEIAELSITLDEKNFVMTKNGEIPTRVLGKAYLRNHLVDLSVEAVLKMPSKKLASLILHEWTHLACSVEDSELEAETIEHLCFPDDTVPLNITDFNKFKQLPLEKGRRCGCWFEWDEKTGFVYDRKTGKRLLQLPSI